MDTILHLLPLTAEQQAALRAAAPGAEHLFLPTHDRRGATDIPADWRARVTILMGYVPPADLRTFPRLKWVQSWNAGVDPYLVPGVLPEGVALICAAGAYVIGGQLAFVSSVAGNRETAAFLVCKLVSGVLAVVLVGAFGCPRSATKAQARAE